MQNCQLVEVSPIGRRQNVCASYFKLLIQFSAVARPWLPTMCNKVIAIWLSLYILFYEYCADIVSICCFRLCLVYLLLIK